MKKIIFISLLLIIGAVGGLFAYVSQMDWNTQKDRVSSQLSEMTGKKIQFSGNLQVALLPHPQLVADNVQIINPQTGEKLASVKRLETEVSLPSLLQGKPDVQSLSLEGVEAWFNFSEQGVSNWHQKEKDVGFAGNNSFNLHSFSVKKSTLHFNHKKYNIAFALTDFNAEVQAGSAEGPYRLDGNFLKDNDRYGLALGLDALSQLEDVDMSMVITHPRTESNLRYDGSYNAASDGAKGVISGQSQKTAEFVNAVFNDKVLRDDYNEPIMFSADVETSTADTKITNLVVKFNNIFEGAGNVDITAPTKDTARVIDVKYQLINLNFVPFRQLIADEFAEIQKGAKFEPNTGFDVKYDISAERVTVSDSPTGIFENVSAKGEWKNNELVLNDFYAGCPGNIVLNIKASLAEKGGEPLYYANVTLDGQNLLSLLNALDIKLKAPRQSSYRDVNLGFDIYGNSKILNVENFALKMDKADINAEISTDLTNNEYTIKVNADILNLDNYIFPLQTEEESDISDIVIAETKRMEWLRDNKADVLIKAKSATFNGVSARDVDIEFITNGAGVVVFENVSMSNLLGSDIEVSGIAENFGEDKIKFRDVAYNIESANIKMLADKLQISLPKWPIFEQDNFIETGVLGGNFRIGYVYSLSKVGDVSLRYDGILKDENETINFDGDVLLKTSHVENLLKLLVGNINGKIYRGPLVAKFYAKGNSKSWNADNADIQMGVDKYKANAEISEEDNVYKIKGGIETDELNLLNWINVQKTKALPNFGATDENTFIAKPDFSGDVINYNSYKNLDLDIDLRATKGSYGSYTMDNLKTHIINTQNDLQFQNLSFENKDHKVSGQLQINYAQTPQMQGKLSVIYPSVNNLGGSVYALDASDVSVEIDFNTSAATIADMIGGLKGQVSVSGNSLNIKGINLKSIYDDLESRTLSKGLYQMVRDNVQSGNTEFGEFKIEAALNNGVITVKPGTIQNDIAEVKVSGGINVKEWKINQTLTVKYPTLKDIPNYSVIFTGMLNKPVVDISVEEIAKKYDIHWKKIEEEELKKQEALRQQKEQKINEMQNKIDDVNEDITSVMKEIEELTSKCLTEEIAKRYHDKTDALNEIIRKLEDLKTKLAGNVSDEDMQSYDNEIENYKQQIAGIPAEIQNYRVEDVDNRKGEMTAQESDVYSKINDLYNDFENMWKDDRDQLTQYNSPSYIDENMELINKKQFMNENKNSIDSIHSDFESRMNSFVYAENLEEKYSVIGIMDNLIEQEEELFSKMQKAHQQVADKLLKIVDERRVVYEKEQQKAEEERRKQAEIDAQNLLINNNPNPVIDSAINIEDKDKNISKEKENVFENTGKYNEDASIGSISGVEEASQVRVSGKITTKYDKPKDTEPIQKNTGGLLSPVSGTAQKASGTIKIK